MNNKVDNEANKKVDKKAYLKQLDLKQKVISNKAGADISLDSITDEIRK